MDVSVVVPAYNSESTIVECLQSIINELEPLAIEYEIIVVDDGSKDNTVNKIKESFDCKRIHVLSQENGGPSKARNTGVKNAIGRLIALNDSDDVWVQDKMKIQLDYLSKNPDVDMVCGCYGFPNDKKEAIKVTLKKELFHNYFSPQTSVLKREIFENILFPEDMKFSEDMYFFIDVLEKYNCHYISSLAAKNVHGKLSFGESGLSSHLWDMEKGELRNIIHASKKKGVNSIDCSIAIVYSLLKFIRRCIISMIHKVKKNSGAK